MTRISKRKQTDYRPIGFVCPTLLVRPIRHNSLFAQHLSSILPVPKLGSFGAEAPFVVTPQGVSGVGQIADP
jgi:hypothetical protein